MSTLEDLDDLEREEKEQKKDRDDKDKKGDDPSQPNGAAGDTEMKDSAANGDKKEEEDDSIDMEILHSSTREITNRRRWRGGRRGPGGGCRGPRAWRWRSGCAA